MSFNLRTYFFRRGHYGGREIIIIGEWGKRYISIVFLLCIMKKNPILVYQVGRVGSQSIEQSLKRYTTKTVYHVHRMLPSNIHKLQKRFLSDKPPHGKIPLRLEDLWLYHNIIKKRRKAKIITLCRSPIDRTISRFFDGLNRYLNPEQIEYVKREKESDSILDLLIDIFFNVYDEHWDVLNWFDDHLKKCLNIDVYDYRFPKQKGYMKINNVVYDLLIIKSEIKDNIKEKAIIDFLNLRQDFKIIRIDDGIQKWYGRLYIKFMKKIKMPESYLTKMLDSKYKKHFYSASEIKNMHIKWSN